MHDRAARPTGAVKSAAAIAIETMILLNIDLRIAQVRPRVEKSVQRLPAPKQALPTRRSVRCPQRISMARRAFSAETADATAREPRETGTKHSALSLALLPPVFICISSIVLRGRR